MGRPLKRWPSYALESLENTLFLLKQMESDTRRVQIAIAERDATAALLGLSDVRASALKCVEHLVRARSGEYEKETQAAWTPNEKEMAR